MLALRIQDGAYVAPEDMPPSISATCQLIMDLWDDLRAQCWTASGGARGICESDLAALWVNIGLAAGPLRLHMRKGILELDKEFHGHLMQQQDGGKGNQGTHANTGD